MKHLSLAALLLLTTATVHAQAPEAEPTEDESGDAEQPEAVSYTPPTLPTILRVARPLAVSHLYSPTASCLP